MEGQAEQARLTGEVDRHRDERRRQHRTVLEHADLAALLDDEQAAAAVVRRTQRDRGRVRAGDLGQRDAGDVLGNRAGHGTSADQRCCEQSNHLAHERTPSIRKRGRLDGGEAFGHCTHRSAAHCPALRETRRCDAPPRATVRAARCRRDVRILDRCTASRRHNGFYRLYPTLATALARKCDSDRAGGAGRAIIPAYSKPELKIVSSPFSSEWKR